MSREARRDVYDTGCGWEDCPECGPRIEVEKARRHRAAIGYPRIDVVSEWQAEEREQRTRVADAAAREDERAAAASARVATHKAKAVARVKRVLTKEQQTEVMGILFERGQKLRKEFAIARADWMAEVWLELLNPTRLVSRREARLSLQERTRKAIHRAEDNIKRSRADEKLYVLVGLHGEKH